MDQVVLRAEQLLDIERPKVLLREGHGRSPGKELLTIRAFQLERGQSPLPYQTAKITTRSN
jgi:hypothetical protein